MIEINLIPDVKQELLNAQRVRAIVISTAIITSIAAVGVIVLLAIYIYGVQSLRHVALDGEIKKQNDEFSQVEDLSKMLTIQNQLATMSALNDGKKIDSRVFDVLSAVVPPDEGAVRLSKVSVDNDATTINLEGQARAYDSMEVFKKTLDSAVVVYTDANGDQQEVKLSTELDTGDVSYGTNSDNVKVVVFNLTFKYPVELFAPSSKNVTIKLSVDGNVTDSYLGIPRSIFTEPATNVEGEE